VISLPDVEEGDVTGMFTRACVPRAKEREHVRQRGRHREMMVRGKKLLWRTY